MDAIFLHGNSGLNIRNGDAFITDKEKRIAKAIFGNGAKDRKTLEEGVFRSHGLGQEGFRISSCQFALHYFFENAKTLHSFLRNVADCTALGGYFIGTCYDGKKVFRMLQRKWKGESFTIQHGSYKVFEITKQYEESGFPEIISFDHDLGDSHYDGNYSDEKTGFDFSKDVYSDVLSVMYDASLFWNEFETTAGSKIGQSIKITTNSNYEQEIISKENVVGMVQSLATNFVKLQKMKHWDMSNALFMPKSKLFDNITKMIIKNNFDKIEAKADTTLQKGAVDSSINFDDVFSELDYLYI
jgi:hypothetical protein